MKACRLLAAFIGLCMAASVQAETPRAVTGLGSLSGGVPSAYGMNDYTRVADLDVEASSTDGSNFVITDGEYSINTQRLPSSNIDRRGVLEFAIAEIPDQASVTAATLELDIWTTTSGEEEFPVLSLYGYAGDGVIEPSDATALSDLLGQSAPVDQLVVIAIELDPGFIQTLLGPSAYLGLVAYGDENNHQIGFTATEAAFFATPPTLTILYDLPAPPLLGDVNADGFVGQADLDIVLAEWGAAPPADPRADPNDDGFVGQGDLDIVLADWGKTSPPPAVPEPATLSIAALCGLALLRRRPKSR